MTLPHLYRDELNRSTLRMGLTCQLIVLLGVSAGLWMGADAKCPKPGDCCMTCPEGWTEFNSRCFYFSAKHKNWCNAEQACVAVGGNLASIRTVSELDFIRKFVVRSTGTETRTWLGGHDAVKEKCWLWSNGDSFDQFKYWGKGEPNDKDKIEDCMEVMGTADQPINDAPCDIAKAFLCARELEKSH